MNINIRLKEKIMKYVIKPFPHLAIHQRLAIRIVLFNVGAHQNGGLINEPA